MKRETWASRSAFLLAAIGSAVGLGNAWRFPGLAAKHGGGAFLLVYVVSMLALGVPLLMMEIAIGRRVHQGTPGAMKALRKKAEPVGWIAVSNGFFICIYYAVVFAWIILMFINSYKFAGLTGQNEVASGLWANMIQTTGTTSGYETIATVVLLCLIVAWAACWWCVRNGTKSVGKVAKYTVYLPLLCLAILAVRGLTMSGSGAGITKLFVPDWTALQDSSLWLDAVGQVFYSMSVSMSIMVAYGSYLSEESNIAVDASIIAVADLFVSVLSSVVMFTTMAGVGMLDNMSASGIATAFIIYPQAIVNLTNAGWVNALFGYVFYFCLITLALGSLFSIVEGVSTAVADKFRIKKANSTLALCVILGLLGLVFVTGAGLAWLDIVDNFINSYTLVLTGVMEAIVAGWLFKTSKILDEVNRNAKKYRMPKWWFYVSIKFVAPVLLAVMFVWNVVTLFVGGGIYGAADGYSLLANIIGGWMVVFLSLISGFVVKTVARKLNAKNGVEEEDITWDNPGNN